MKTLNKILLFAGIVLFGFSSCKKEEQVDEVRKDITGSVTKAGSAVQGAVVSIIGNVTTTTTTDANGTYRFYALAKGTYDVDASYRDSQGFTFESSGAKVVVGNQGGEVKVDLTVE